MRITMQPIRPRKNFLDYREYDAEIREAVVESGAWLLIAFNSVVANWTHKPQFKKRLTIKADSIAFDVYPSGENAKIWRYVDEGTQGHFVAPRKAKALRFNQYYATRTAPGGHFGGPGKSFGPVRFSKGHWVRGIKARNFSESLLKGAKPVLIAQIRQAIKDAGS